MDELTITRLQEERNAAQTLATLFLTLPTRESIEAVLQLDPELLSGNASGETMAVFINDNRLRDSEEVFLDVSRDRARLIRGTEVGYINPPYESLYLQTERSGVLAALNRFCAECGLHKTADAHDAIDQIGVECSLLAALETRQLEALHNGDMTAADNAASCVDRFKQEHLFRWAGLYADELITKAQTTYWKAVGLMIKDAFNL